MTAGKSANFWTLIIILLGCITVIGGAVIWTKHGQDQPIEISLAPVEGLRGQIYIGGAVNNPGVYPMEAVDTLEEIIQAAGGTTASADPGRLNLNIPEAGGVEPPQKVNINQADAWLLQALPGIGETRARAIIDYRQRNGPFRNINELVKVAGIGAATYENIKHLITVAD